MIRNLRKYGALTMVSLGMVAMFGVANADCRKADGSSRDGSVGPVELMPLCAEQESAKASDSTVKAETKREQVKQREHLSTAATFESMDTIR